MIIRELFWRQFVDFMYNSLFAVFLFDFIRGEKKERARGEEKETPR
jgi:hypothetical protein